MELNAEEWLAFSEHASWYAAREKARSMEIDVAWNASWPRRPKAISRCRAAWSTPSRSRWQPRHSPTFYGWRRRPANLQEAKAFADAIHAEYPGQDAGV